MYAPPGQDAKYQGSQQSMHADLPHLLPPHRSDRTSLEGLEEEVYKAHLGTHRERTNRRKILEYRPYSGIPKEEVRSGSVLGEVVLKGVVWLWNGGKPDGSEEDKKRATRLMALHECGVVAWYVPDSTGRHSDNPPDSQCSIRHTVSHILSEDVLLMHVFDPDTGKDIRFRVETSSQPNAAAWHRALEHMARPGRLMSTDVHRTDHKRARSGFYSAR